LILVFVTGIGWQIGWQLGCVVGVKRFKARVRVRLIYIYSDAQGVRGGPWLRVMVRVPVRVAVRVWLV